MQKARLTVSSHVYRSHWNTGKVEGALSVTFTRRNPDGEAYCVYSEPENYGASCVTVTAKEDLEGNARLEILASLYTHEPAILAAAAKAMKQIAADLSRMEEEDGEPASLGEAMRRAARALGVGDFYAEGQDVYTKAPVLSSEWSGAVKDLSELGRVLRRRLKSHAATLENAPEEAAA